MWGVEEKRAPDLEPVEGLGGGAGTQPGHLRRKQGGGAGFLIGCSVRASWSKSSSRRDELVAYSVEMPGCTSVLIIVGLV